MQASIRDYRHWHALVASPTIVPMWRDSTELLTRAECFDLLGGARVGRVAVSIAALPAVVPVDYTLLGEDLIVRARAGGRLGAALAGNVVAFEVDAADTEGDTAWTVHVVGLSELISDRATLDELARRSPAIRASGDDDHVVRITVREVTGRRFEPTKERVRDR